MSVPDLWSFVLAIYSNGGPWNLHTHEGCGRFTEACARALNNRDGNFGHLRKFGAQNQYNGHAVDALLHKATGQAIDIIIGSETASARPAWQVEEVARYADSTRYWMTPTGSDPGPPPVVVQPPVPPVLACRFQPAPEVNLSVLVDQLHRIERKLDLVVSSLGNFPVYRGRIFGAGFSLHPDVSEGQK